MTNKQIESVLATVAADQPVVTHLKRINGGKVSVQLAEKIKGEVNLVSLLNKEDDRFNQQRFSLAWISGTPESVIREFKLNVTLKQINALQVATGIPDIKLEEGKTKLNLGIVNPEINGNVLHVQISEHLSPQYDGHDPKRAGADGDFLTFEGKLIYRTTSVVAGPARHSRINHDGRVPAGAYGKMNQETVNNAMFSFLGKDEPK